MLAEPVAVADRRVHHEIDVAQHAGRLGIGAPGAEAAALEPQDIGRDRRMRGRRDEVHRPAEGRSAEGQRVAALEDLGRPQRERIDLVEVEAAIGHVEWNAVLQDLDPAPMEGAPDARAADGQPHFLAIAGLRPYARHVLEHVAQVVGVGALQRLHVDPLDGARRLQHQFLLFLDTGDGQGPGGRRGHGDGREVGCRGGGGLRPGDSHGGKGKREGAARQEDRTEHGTTPFRQLSAGA